MLLAGGGRDRRLPLLGGRIPHDWVRFCASRCYRYVRSSGLDGTHGESRLRPLSCQTAFLALMLWRFVREFPVDTQRLQASPYLQAVFVEHLVRCRRGAVRDQHHVGWLRRFHDARSGSGRCSSFSTAIIRNASTGRSCFAIGAPAIPFLTLEERGLDTYEDKPPRDAFRRGADAFGLAPFVLGGGWPRHSCRPSGIRRCSRVLASSCIRGACFDCAGYCLRRCSRSRHGPAFSRQDHTEVRPGTVRCLGS